jgi:hypothetical protein
MKHARILTLVTIVALVLAAGCSSDKTTQAPIPPDDAPPLPPTGLWATFAPDGTAEVSWHPNTEADLAGYRVYLFAPIPSRPTAYELQNPDELWTATTVPIAIPIGGEIWVCVSAVDQGSNESSNSSPLQVEWQQPAPAENDDNPKAPLEGEQQPRGGTRGGTTAPPPTGPPSGGGDDGTTPGDDPNQH